MSISEARKKATAKYKLKNYDRIDLFVKKGLKQKIKDFASVRGKSLNGFINEAINEKMERDEKPRG